MIFVYLWGAWIIIHVVCKLKIIHMFWSRKSFSIYFEQDNINDDRLLSLLCKCFGLFHAKGHSVRGTHRGLIRYVFFCPSLLRFALYTHPCLALACFYMCSYPCIYIAPFLYFAVFSCPFLPCSALFCLVTIISITSSTSIALQTCTVCFTKWALS